MNGDDNTGLIKLVGMFIMVNLQVIIGIIAMIIMIGISILNIIYSKENTVDSNQQKIEEVIEVEVNKETVEEQDISQYSLCVKVNKERTFFTPYYKAKEAIDCSLKMIELSNTVSFMDDIIITKEQEGEIK